MVRSVVGRIPLAYILAAAVAGCGGDSSTSPDDDSRPGAPASVAVHAGNGQSAQVGAPVATAPAVVVKDARGRAVPGTRVSFAVEQGGGSVGASNPTTDSNGIATAGQWVMGATAGAQRLVATVAGLPGVTFTATATGDEAVVATQPIGPSGGSITVNRGDSPLNGVRLTFDPGALPSSVPVTLSEVPASQLSIPSGMTARSPGLGISASVGRTDAGVSVRFPATPAPGEILMVGFANATTGAVTLLPTIRQEANAITALVPSLDASGGTASVVSRSLVASSAADTPGSVVMLLAINEELLERDFDSGYRPGVDDWDFRRMAIADLAFAKRPSDRSAPFAVADDGMISTSLWYYVNRRKQGAPQLNGSTQLLAGQPLSSRAGIRWATLAGKDVPAINQTGSLLVREWSEWATDDRGRFLWLQFRGIKALMLTTFERPVPVVLLDTDDPDEFNAESHPMAIAFRTTGNTLHLAWPGDPGRTIQVEFSEQGMTPFTLSNANGTAMTVRAIGGVHYVNVVNDGKLAAQWPRVANGTIGDAEGWPTPELHWEKDQLDTARTYLLDELQMWWECAECPERTPRPAQLPATASHVQRFQSISVGSGSGGALSGLFSSASLSAEDTFKEGERLDRKGFVVLHPVEQDGFVGGVAIGWLDWQGVAFRKLELTPSLESIESTKDTTITLTVTPSEAPPTGTRYRWLLRTDDLQDSVETTVPNHTREIEAGTDGWLVFSALEGEHKRPIARDSIRVSGEASVAAWRILTLSDPNGMFDETEASGNEAELLRRLIQVPASGLISIEEIEGEKVLRLRVKRSGRWSADDCCPVAAYSAGAEHAMPLGFSPARSHPVGPFFSGWGTSFWEQSSESLDAGNVTGQYALGTTTYRVEDAGTQIGPAGGIRISAVRNGTSMVGEIAVYIWYEDDDTGEVAGGADVYRLPFTAVRMR